MAEKGKQMGKDKEKHPLSAHFDDVADVEVTKDDEGIVKIKGVALYRDVQVKITVTRRDNVLDSLKRGKKITSADPLYKGTVSLLSPDGKGEVLISEFKKRVKGEGAKRKDLYATASVWSNSTDSRALAADIFEKANKLIEDNRDQLNNYALQYMTPDQVSAVFAVDNYLENFVSEAFPNSSAETQKHRKNRIKRVFLQLRNVPLCKIRSKEANALARADAASDTGELCALFYDYLLNKGTVCGKNPFTQYEKTISLDQRNKKAFSAKTLDDSVFQELIRLANKDLLPLYCGVLLAASGFSLSDIRKLKWADIGFVASYTDYAIIGIRRDQLLLAKHDFSRPAIPDVAMYLHSVYQKLLEQFPPEELAKRYVVTCSDASDKPAENKEIILAANNLLIRAGYKDSLVALGRPAKDEEAIPISLLQSHYRHMLISKAGLKDDADTYHFLAGLVYRSSTFTNYESHTSSDAQDRLHTILQPLSAERPIRQIAERHQVEDKLVYRAVPKSNHEAVQILGNIILKPGEEIRIRVPHGVTGRIEIQEFENGSTRELEEGSK